MDELAVAGETVEIVAQVGLLDPVRGLLKRRIVVNDVPRQPLGKLLPKLVVPVEDLFRQRRQRLPVDLHNDAKGREVRIHPVQGKAFLHEELILRIVIEHDFGQQPVDVHHGNLPGDLDALLAGDRITHEVHDLTPL